MSEYSWKFKSLDELGSISRGKSKHRPRDASHLFGGSYPFIQTGDVKSAGLILDSYSETYSEEGLAQSKLWPKGTLCITIAANIAETSILGIDACFPDSIIGFIPHENECDVRYVKYVLELKKMEIQAAFAGSVQLNMSMKELLKWKFPIPSYAIQRKIGDYVSDYDYMVRSNRNISYVSQQLISNLFRSWFIDFDPVKSKVEGKLPYGMDEETAALFPDSFKDSQLGPIPSGWNVGRIGDIADISSGKHQPERSEQKSSEYCTPLLGGAGIIAWTAESLFDEPIIVIGRVGTLGVVKKYTSPVWPSDNTLIFKTHQNSSFHYLLHHLRLQDFGAYNRGSTQPLLTQSDMRKLKLIIPNEDVLLAFEERICSMSLLSDILEEQSKYLTKTRDALLPRLMSGELK